MNRLYGLEIKAVRCIINMETNQVGLGKGIAPMYIYDLYSKN